MASADTPASGHTNPQLDVIYINLNAASDFIMSHGNSSGTLEEELATIHQHVQDGCYKIVSINGSEHSCVLVMSTELSKAQLREKGFPFPRR